MLVSAMDQHQPHPYLVQRQEQYNAAMLACLLAICQKGDCLPSLDKVDIPAYDMEWLADCYEILKFKREQEDAQSKPKEPHKPLSTEFLAKFGYSTK